MIELGKKSKVKKSLGILTGLALTWLLLFLYLTLSPTVALETCVDRGGLWLEIEGKPKCYCETPKDKENCATVLEDAYKRVAEEKTHTKF